MNRDDKFFQYHSDNPDVYKAFKRLAVQAKNAGHLRYSGWAIMNQVRWHMDVINKMPDGPRIPNQYIALYTRLLIRDNPRYRKFFNLRPLKETSELSEVDSWE